MNRIILLLFFVVSVYYNLNAQCGGRYLEDMFPSLITHKDIEYGQNLDSKGILTSLLLDVYEPEEDTLSLRPLIIFVHGGSFVGGDRRDQDIDKAAQYFAKKGYVTANIEYRVEQTNFITPFLNFADKNNFYKAIVRVVHDVNASIRYFKKQASEHGNIYRIDTNQIILYGSSAGAIACLHSIYLDNLEEASVDFKNNFLALGGLEGNSGNNGYTSKNTIKAIVSCSGAMDNLNYMNNNLNVKYIGFHHSVDLSVPYDKGCFVTVACHLNQFYGGKQIAQKLKNTSAVHEFYTFNKLGHPADAVSNTVDRSFLLEKATLFLHNNVVCNDQLTSIQKNNYQTLKLFPNPASNYFSIEYDKSVEQKDVLLQICNSMGEIVWEKNTKAISNQTETIDLKSGMYVVRIIGKNDAAIFLSKLIVAN